MKRTNRLALRRELLAEISADELAAAYAAAAAQGDTTWNCPTDICIVLPGISNALCNTTPLENTCWACG